MAPAQGDNSEGVTAPAKEIAEANGFVVIELGKRAEAEKAREIYELVYRVLNELFTSIARG